MLMFPIPNMPRGWDFPAPAAPGLGTCRVETKIARHLEVFFLETAAIHLVGGFKHECYFP
jgi:hypothetical protein